MANAVLMTTVTRRKFLQLAGMAGVGAMNAPAIVRASAAATGRPRAKRCIVLGIDGMDPSLATQFMRAGRLPNFSRLAREGMFRPLGTSQPPQSPVAWSNFISGANPGTHGIFDFIARDPATLTPYLSTSRLDAPGRAIHLSHWRFPITGGAMRNLRQGPTLWVELEKRGVPCTVLRMPANFPPTAGDSRALSGLGTPDIHGGYGIFTRYTGCVGERTRDVAGGHIERVRVQDNVVKTVLPGPVNTLDTAGSRTDVPFAVYLDPSAAAVRVKIQQSDFVLREGEWSDWVLVRFTLVPHVSDVSGVCRFFLKRFRDDFELFVTPVNIDPVKPVLPISSPSGYSAEIARRMGRFYTQGMAETTNALSAGALDDAQYREQALQVLRESQKMFDVEFSRFREGFFFFYYSTLDLNSHTFWRTLDPGHPLYTRELAARHGDFLPWLYEEMDREVGKALAACDPETLLIVLSDHGFTSFRRQFNLNTWLLENGYAMLNVGANRGVTDFFGDTRWGETRAYGLGINSLYLNQKGREPDGCVDLLSREALRSELIARLTTLVDPVTHEKPIYGVYRPEEIYNGPEVKNAPDLIVGYSPNYRASWDTILGKYSREVLLDNRDPWSGDHCLDRAFMSGCIFSNRRIPQENPALETLFPYILDAMT
jgi:predicted AlkP superfamily phosphohydrolase/phosphomutase